MPHVAMPSKHIVSLTSLHIKKTIAGMTIVFYIIYKVNGLEHRLYLVVYVLGCESEFFVKNLVRC